ncbi:MAG: IS3 family transposase [Bryobacteraceae bacterium]
MNRTWVEPDKRDQVVDFVRRWAEKTSVPVERILKWLELSVGKFYDWCQRYGQVNHHNGKVPRDFWLHGWEKQRILDFQLLYPQEGYRRLTYMMIDADIVAVSPSSVYRVLHQAGRLARYPSRSSRKGNGFDQPLKPHEHWHIDIAHINIHGTFYYLCAVLDGASRYMVNWTLRESMREPEVEILLEQAKEKFPEARPRIISDNGPQFIAKDFKEFIRISGMTHVRTSPYYPQSNGKLERWNQSIKSECIRPGTPLSLDQALELVGQYVDYYNHKRLHSAIGYVTPADFLAGRQAFIHAGRDQKLEVARQKREQERRKGRNENLAAIGSQPAGQVPIPFLSGETEAGSAGTQPC